MAVTIEQITIPSDGSIIPVFLSTPNNASQLSIRNTGTVVVFLGNQETVVFPLNSGEFLGIQCNVDDALYACVQSGSVNGQITVLGMG